MDPHTRPTASCCGVTSRRGGGTPPSRRLPDADTTELVAASGSATWSASVDPGVDAPTTVVATDDSCTVGVRKLAAGAQTFAIRNEGSKVTEVYVYGSDDRVMAEAESIKRDGSRDLTVLLRTGLYTVACKPGMTRDEIRQSLTVVPASSSTAAATDPQAEAGVHTYTAYVQRQVADLTGKTKAFTDA